MTLKQQKTIVSDTSCLILLDKIGQLPILKSLFGTITVTSVIAREFGQSLPDFIVITDPVDQKYLKILESFLDRGEASAMALAIEKDDCLLIIDEFKGRREALKMGINITGTIGIILLAKERGFINSVSELLDEIQRTNFRMSGELLKEIRLKIKNLG